MRVSPLLLALLLGATLAAAPAQASFPGANGDIVLTLDDRSCELGSDLFTAGPGGGALTKATDVCAGEDDEGSDHYIAAPEAAPDGRSLLAFADGGVVTLKPDGSGVSPVPAPAGIGYDRLSGSPAVSFTPGGGSFVAKAVDGPLYEVFLDGRPARLIRPGGSVVNPRVSPDGKLIAALRPSGLWLFSFKSGKAVRRLSSKRNIVDYDWSPNAKRLVYATRYQQREIKGGAAGGNLFLIGRDGKGQHTLVHREDIAETEPTWSPSGRSIAWVSLGFSAGDVGFSVSPSLWRVSLKSGRRTRLRKLQRPDVEEAFYHAPELTWLSR